MQIIMTMLIIAEGQGWKPVSRFVKLALRRTMHNWPMELDKMELCVCVCGGGWGACLFIAVATSMTTPSLVLSQFLVHNVFSFKTETFHLSLYDDII